MASNRKIALLRGINVGGKNKVKMQDLVYCLSDAGLDNVRTYIQSGNIAFDSRAKCGELETRVHQSLQESFGFDVSVMVRTDKAWGKLVAENPFCDSGVPTCDVKELHVTLLGKKPTKKAIDSLSDIKLDGDQYEVIGDRVYLRIVNGYSKTKLTNGLLEKRLGVAATSRNWKTVCKIAEL